MAWPSVGAVGAGGEGSRRPPGGGRGPAGAGRAGDATRGLATEASLAELRVDLHTFRAEIYRALWIQGAGIIAATAAIIGIATALD